MVWLAKEKLAPTTKDLSCVLHTDQSQLVETCPKSVWRWKENLDSGSLSIKYKTKKKAGVHTCDKCSNYYCIYRKEELLVFIVLELK